MKNWKKKIAIVALAWMASTFMIGGIETASAADYIPKVGGECPNAGTEVPLYNTIFCAEKTQTTECSDPDNPSGDKVYVDKDLPSGCPKSAGGGGDSGTGSKAGAEAIDKFLAILISIQGLLSRLFWPIIAMIGGLLSNDILFGAGMEEQLYSIWVPIRNIVNIVFVLALVGLALYSVLGVNSENSQYSIKTLLPKVIAGIIAVNFSFLIIKVMLDGINVFTTAVFAIPTNTEAVMSNAAAEKNPEVKERIEKFCKEVYNESGDNIEESIENTAYRALARQYGLGHQKIVDIKHAAEQIPDKAKFKEDLEALKDRAFCAKDSTKVILSDLGEAFFKKYGTNNAAFALAVNMGGMPFYKGATASMGSNVIESMTITVLFSVLMHVVYLVSFLALFIVLLARLIVMWLGLAFSPIIALTIAVPVIKEQLGLGDLIQKFVKHAIAPLLIALTMMVGWVMLNAVKSTIDSNTGSLTQDALIPGIPIPGLETLQGLLVALATIAVVWVGVFASAQGTIAEKLTGFVKDRLESAGKFLATAPFKYIPWVPVHVKEGGDPEMLTIDGIDTAIRNKAYEFKQEGIKKANQVFGVGQESQFAGPESAIQVNSAEDLMNWSKRNAKGLKEDKDGKFKTAIKDKFKTNSGLVNELEAILASEGNPAQKAFAANWLKLIKDGTDPKNLNINYETLADAAKKERAEKKDKEGDKAPDKKELESISENNLNIVTNNNANIKKDFGLAQKGGAQSAQLKPVISALKESQALAKMGDEAVGTAPWTTKAKSTMASLTTQIKANDKDKSLTPEAIKAKALEVMGNDLEKELTSDEAKAKAKEELGKL